MSEGQIPNHVAIIPDGNGRWAKARGLPRYEGHRQGIRRVKETVNSCLQTGVKYLTLYIFSTENWKRPEREIEGLLDYFKKFIVKELPALVKQRIRLQFIGARTGRIPRELRAVMSRAELRTKTGDALTVVVAFNYGARQEILNAVKILIRQRRMFKDGKEEITEDSFRKYLYTRGIPDPDLLIRTSGEKRISNFLLWQMSYTELYFAEVCWPDFDAAEFKKALAEYALRKRRFGGLSTNNDQ